MAFVQIIEFRRRRRASQCAALPAAGAAFVLLSSQTHDRQTAALLPY